MPRTLLRLVLLALAALLLIPAAASAAGSIRLTSDRYSVGEGDGDAVITIVRDDVSERGEIRYDAYYDRSAEANQDWKPVQGTIRIDPGVAEASFRIPIVDDSIVEEPETVKVGIYGPYNATLAEPDRGILTIVDNDTIATPDQRDAANPLGLAAAPTTGNPLQGARFFVDREWNLARVAMREHSDKKGVRKLRVIADQPETKRFGAWTTHPRHEMATFLQRVQTEDPGAIPLVATYTLRHVACGGVADSPADVEDYKRWYDGFAEGIGNQPVVLFYEIDALITMKCLSGPGRAARIEEVKYAIDVLSKLPRAVVYVDAGSGLAHGAPYIAAKLRQVGVSKIQGFFTNATHQDRTLKEIRYARQLVRLTGGTAHYVINTSGNGQGPLIPRDRVKDGNSFRCNAPGRGLGPRPTSTVPRRFKGLDGLFWIGNPGRSAGSCAEELYPEGTVPPTGSFWLRYALQLIKHANFKIT